MNRSILRFIAFLMLITLTGTPFALSEASSARRVILDTDIQYMNDDAVAMFMLAVADARGELDFLGVTTVGCNEFVATETCAALRQLELIGREDIPVYEGTDVPLQGFRNMEEEARLYGIPDYCGAYWNFSTDWFTNPDERSTDYLDLDSEPRFGYPTTAPGDQTAADFMIEQVHQYPGEVTIMAIGSATNVAIALQKDPDFVRDAAGIIYMGGDIDVGGNATPAAEINWYYDPAAIKLCLAADWKSQIVVPDDLSRQVFMDESIFRRLREREGTAITELVLMNEKNFDPKVTHFVWDVVVPAIYLHPEIVTDLQTRYLTVDDNPGLNSGRAVSWQQNRHNDPATGEGMPEGVRPVQIVMEIDQDAFWDFYVDSLTGN